ncbi:DUF2306 domain-containing protein [Amycolatopsis sp. NPDC059021]|uniref:DUF2306 domain-containing protein n=1 Tax=Amycolatopsis sp. NPDC059021 TaxID=3346704 RepID=UPI00367069FF
MTQTPELRRPLPPPEKSVRRRWFRPGMILLGLLIAAFMILYLPRYLTLDPGQSLIPVNEGFRLHYPLLIAHIATGTIALVTVCLQVSSWLRRRHPRVHRLSGRLYVFAGIGPSAVLSLAVMPFGILTGLSAVGSSLWAVLTLGVTTAGYVAARQRRWADHRRFMLYSFGLATSILTGRALFTGAWYAVAPIFPDSETTVLTIAQFAGFWLNWIVNIAVVAWWLRRSGRKAGLPG